ncbi:MAG: hypothetical protein M3513_01435 [Actinomycetota bacterium]|nr:hypothetical protein [Actinomycetota bacterium]
MGAEPVSGAGLQLLVVQLVPIPATVLGPVEREVGLLEQVLDIAVGRGGHCDTDADGQRQRLPVAGPGAADLERFAHEGDEAFGEDLDVLRRGEPLGQDDELVSTEAGHAVGRAAGGLEPVGHRDQHFVTDVVTQGVVDVLEPVQVQQQQGDGTGVARQPGQGLAAAFPQGGPVGGPGQGVGLGLHQEGILRGHPFGHVAGVADHGDQLAALPVPDLSAGGLQPAVGAVVAPEPGRDRDGARVVEQAEQRGPDPADIRRVDEPVDVPAEHLRRRPAEHALPGGRDVVEATVAVGHRDRVRRVLRQQPVPRLGGGQLDLGLLAVGDVVGDGVQGTARVRGPVPHEPAVLPERGAQAGLQARHRFGRCGGEQCGVDQGDVLGVHQIAQRPPHQVVRSVSERLVPALGQPAQPTVQIADAGQIPSQPAEQLGGCGAGMGQPALDGPVGQADRDGRPCPLRCVL